MPDARLVELIYAGLSDPGQWQTFLNGFRERIRARHAIFVIAYSDNPSYSLVLSSGMNPADEEDFTKWATHDPWVARVDWSTALAGQFRASQDICPDEILEATDVYQQFYRRLDWHYGGGVLMASAPSQKALLNSLRPKRLGPFNAEEVALHEFLSPHLVRAVALHDERLRLRAEQTASRALLDAAGGARLLLSKKGEIRLANAAARTQLASAELLFSQQGHVRAKDPGTHATLLAAIGRVGAPDSSGTHESLVLSSNNTTLWATVSKLDRPGDSTLATHATAVALSLTNPAHRPRLVPEPLQRLYGLTAAEAHVALLLADGLTADDVAVCTGVVLDTARTHIKRILAKTQLNRQPELVSLVLRVARPPLMHQNGVAG